MHSGTASRNVTSTRAGLRSLAATIGRNYSKLVANVQTKSRSLKDFCFTLLPFCISFAVCASFHYLLRRRNLYATASDEFGRCGGLLSGMAWADTIDDLRNALFDENEKEKQKPWQARARTEQMVLVVGMLGIGKSGTLCQWVEQAIVHRREKVYLLRDSVMYEGKQTALDFERLGMSGASRGVDLRAIKKSESDVRERQPRLRFYAGAPSPVCSCDPWEFGGQGANFRRAPPSSISGQLRCWRQSHVRNTM